MGFLLPASLIRIYVAAISFNLMFCRGSRVCGQVIASGLYHGCWPMYRSCSMATLVPPSEQRSRNMAAIRSRDTKLELLVRHAVHRQGFRYRLHNRSLPGKPDLVFHRYSLVVLVHGCYWHGHICKEAKRPNSNLSYWTPKIEGNMARDAKVTAALQASGWEVFIVRECSVKEDTIELIELLATKRAKSPCNSAS
jgi:DNA mismatch endonuclease (patch repair protein)